MPRLIVALVVLLSLLTSAIARADSPVTIDCGDGSALNAVVDDATLASLQSSLGAMLDNPTGVTCLLSAAAIDPTVSIAASSSSRAFVVGGGRFDRGPGPGSMQGCGLNFSLSAHADNNGVHGEQTYTINNADGCGDLSLHGHIKANVTCLDVLGNEAQLKGVVSEVSGEFFSSLAAVGDTLETDVEDNGNPSSGIADRIDVFPRPPLTNLVCAASGSPFFEVENGNITVHQ
jgi:hypothetical protein